jgi:hypothetical protein
MSRHAQVRARQRGFSTADIDIIWNYGRETYAPGGTIKYFLGNEQCRYALKDQKEKVQAIEHAKGGTLVIADGILITAYRM